jgi:hypothetical protein
MLYRQAILRGAALAFLFCGVTTSLACRFNVRDVGFVDLGSKPYQLFCYVERNTPQELISQIEDISLAALLDSNIETEVVNVDQQDAHPSHAYLTNANLKKLPIAALVSPDGRSIPLTLLDDSKSNSAESLWTAFESIYESPWRNKVMESVLNTYGAIILLEGDDAAENHKARAAADKSIAAIAKLIRDEKLEKEIETPPVLHVLSRKEASREGITLWGMGIDVNEPGAQIAMLYGRGRKIGKTLKGAQLNDQTVHAVLNTIGLSCECGLDRSWMQGGMIPLKWGDDIQSQVAKHLGFDPESPAIKMEMSQILSKGGAGQGAKIKVAQADIDTLLAGYSEISAAASETVPPADATTASDSTNSTPAASDQQPAVAAVTKLYEIDESKGEPIAPEETNDSKKRLRHMMMFLGMVAVFVVFAGVFVLFRGRSSG